MIPIEETKRVDWNAIRAEYIGGGISQRKLAKKYGLTYAALRNKADIEGWVAMRDDVQRKSNAEATQKTASAAAEYATTAIEFRSRLLERLMRIEEKYPLDATEVRTRQGNSTAIFRIRDLTAAYKDLTEDMPKEADTTTLDKLDALLQEAWDAAYR